MTRLEKAWKNRQKLLARAEKSRWDDPVWNEFASADREWLSEFGEEAARKHRSEQSRKRFVKQVIRERMTLEQARERLVKTQRWLNDAAAMAEAGARLTGAMLRDIANRM